MVHNTAVLGGTASNVKVAKVAHGLMRMTWSSERVVPDEQCFEAIKASVDAAPPGAKMFMSSAEFFGPGESTANLEMLSRFFEKYPDYTDRTFLVVSGGCKERSLVPDASPENLRRSVDNINAALRGKKRMDLFQCGRVDKKVPIEDTIRTLVGLIKEGKFDHIGMSECSAQTLRKAHAVYPISVVEIEISPWSYEEETRKVIAIAKELGVAVSAYSPLGMGFLTGSIKTVDDILASDMRRSMVRFQEEAIEHNMALVRDLTAIAERRKITPAQLCIAWVSSLGPHVVPMPGSSAKKRTLENLASDDVEFSKDELAEINEVINKHEVKGQRYYGEPERENLWG
ncbi:Aldo/keto reductase [Laetiporus sulphureus 93-53]|uniref:Aldo/keto reductase n=1 Tax=Laetiporus sulphureus 93-53 TaxID=1314785 RepID=A0A165H4K7_9APHY|nr:Aldo/keto reductase [Laetiporus sulphureus 93-53]KZT11236.1 Aldo/keto reductase [Laetiporus sulphureus 93-53]